MKNRHKSVAEPVTKYYTRVEKIHAVSLLRRKRRNAKGANAFVTSRDRYRFVELIPERVLRPSD